MDQIRNSKWGVNGSFLKWFAILTMLVDHVGACLIEVYVMNIHGTSPYQGYGSLSYEQSLTWYWVDYALRCVGRLAFPVFCFLLVEGFLHTRDVKKYTLRMGVFCVLSEIPFDLALFGQVARWDYQNVFFTLLLALLGLWALTYLEKRNLRFLGVLCVLGAAVLAEVLNTDYGAFGVAVVAVLYLCRGQKAWQLGLGAGCFLLYGGTEMLGALAFLPIALYNGKRGKQPKYFFYVFYPLHLVILAAVGMWILPGILG